MKFLHYPRPGGMEFKDLFAPTHTRITLNVLLAMKAYSSWVTGPIPCNVLLRVMGDPRVSSPRHFFLEVHLCVDFKASLLLSGGNGGKEAYLHAYVWTPAQGTRKASSTPGASRQTSSVSRVPLGRCENTVHS